MPVLGTRAVCAELRKALDKRANARTVDSQPYYGWSYAYPSGGLIQKYLSAQIGIAFRRVEGPARNAKQRGFILRVGMLHDPLDHVNLRDVGFRWDRLRLNDDAVWATTIPFDESLLQDWDLGLGPLDWD
jgi:hypothetical protein